MLAFQPDESHPMVDALLRPRLARWRELNRAIDGRDDMLDFALKLHDYDRDAALTNYFQNGLEQFQLVRHIAGWRSGVAAGGGGATRRMLDFASGYGRLTRFLVHERFADVTVSDILEGGMEFQAAQFGVKTILSATNPDDLVVPETYDVIFVASLFTHLPPATFTPWLRRLALLLEPEGLLIFSVHDESIAPEKVSEGGISFATRSESRVLDTSEYGSTWVTESYVREQVAAIDPRFACVRMHRALSDWQDVYVVSPSPIPDPRPRRAPKGFIESVTVDAEGIRFTGWATAVDEAPDRIEVRIDDDVVATTRAFHRRDDVGHSFRAEAAAESGWELVVPHGAVRSFRYQTATVSVFTRENVERILFLGTIDAAAGFVAKERARARDNQIVERNAEIAALREELAVLAHARASLEQQIAAMRRSRFWRAREQWFRMKRAVGLTDEA